MLAADFIAVTQLLVYVGGILVLLVFGVMLTNRVVSVDMKSGSLQVLPASIVVSLAAGTLCGVFSVSEWRVIPSETALPTTGPLVTAAFPGFTWERASVEFPPGSRLLMFTDGIPETAGESGEFGTVPIERAIEIHPTGGAPLLDAIVDRVRRHAGGRPQTDDWTLLAAGRP